MKQKPRSKIEAKSRSKVKAKSKQSQSKVEKSRAKSTLLLTFLIKQSRFFFVFALSKKSKAKSQKSKAKSPLLNGFLIKQSLKKSTLLYFFASLAKSKIVTTLLSKAKFCFSCHLLVQKGEANFSTKSLLQKI